MNKQKKKITDIRSINLMALFAALTAIGAFIRIPLPYVPITLQTIFVLLAGVLLGKKRAALSQVIYLVIGLAGVPVFTEGGGRLYPEAQLWFPAGLCCRCLPCRFPDRKEGHKLSQCIPGLQPGCPDYLHNRGALSLPDPDQGLPGGIIFPGYNKGRNDTIPAW